MEVPIDYEIYGHWELAIQALVCLYDAVTDTHRHRHTETHRHMISVYSHGCLALQALVCLYGTLCVFVCERVSVCECVCVCVCVCVSFHR